MRLDYRANAKDLQEQAERTDAVLQALKGLTPKQIDAWMTTNITTLAQARTLIAKMLYVLAHFIP